MAVMCQNTVQVSVDELQGLIHEEVQLQQGLQAPTSPASLG